MGVAFIGPPPAAIDEMGDKVSRAARRRLRGGAPIVPGTTEFAKSADEIRAFGEEYGWPIAIKAAFGGGGRGMKVVQSAAEVDDAMDSAQREAKAFFGRDEIYVERYLTWPRHVEVQIVGDQHGNVVWVCTRDCSAQRRHQKLIEEAPAPGLRRGVEDAMGEAAVKAAKAVGYYNAGTVEFIYQDGEFFFLEMNTRLQVEHPVTEVITGIDLVEWQIRVAVGRAAADDAGGGRGPAAGPRHRDPDQRREPGRRQVPAVARARSPSSSPPDGFGVRFDGGYESGDDDQPVLRQPRRQADRVGQGPPDGDRPHDPRARGDGRRGRRDHDPRRPRDPPPPRLRRRCSTRTKWVEETLDLSGIDAPAPRRPRRPTTSEAEPLVERTTTVEVNGKRFDVKMWVPESAPRRRRRRRRGARPRSRGAPAAAAAAVPPGAATSRCRCRARSSRCSSRSARQVEAGQAIVVLEAMKMENQIAAEKAGTVKEIKVAAGDTVGAGDVVASSSDCRVCP